ncbi:adenylate/guanylate cyclase domain-containing protein [bacterium]|nr:adenylate/guanylate cyclase domain-containing protein [bacterium]
MTRKWLMILFFLVLSGGLTWYVHKHPFCRVLEWKAFDWQFRIRGERSPSQDIVIIAIDEPTFHTLKMKYPFPPLVLGKLIEKLNRHGASVIGFDLLYSEPTRECDPPEQDRLLAEIIAEAGNVLWGCELENGQRLVLPIDVIRDSLVATGFLNFPDEVDNRVRRFKVKEAGTYSFAAAVMKAYAGFLPGQWDTEELYLIDYCGAAGVFHTFSFADVLEDRLAPGSLEGKICLVGPTFLASHDYYATPFHDPARPDTPGVEIHANILMTLWSGHQFIIRDLWWPAICFMTVLAGGIILLMFGHVAWSGVIGLSALITWIVFSIYSFQHFQIVPLVAPVGGAVFLYLAGGTASYLSERKEKKRIRMLFSSYVDPAIVSYLLKNPDLINTTGVRREVTILYSDIEGFSDISSNRTPEELVSQLNIYFEKLTNIILSHDGMYDKYVGDALMAVFGFPLSDPAQAMKAVFAALEIQDQLDVMNTRWREQKEPEFRTRIGISSGEAVIGPVGGTQRKDFTAYGTVVNRAARLEAFNKTLGTRILIDQNTAEALSSEITLVNYGPHKLKGLSEDVVVYCPVRPGQA